MNNGFIFYPSFREAVRFMPPEQKAEFLDVLCEYAFDGTINESASPWVQSIMATVRPLIDANSARRENGKKGGRPPKKPMVVDGFENEKPMVAGGFENEKPNNNNNNNNNKNKNNNSDSDNDKEFASERTPTKEEIESFVKEKGLNVDAESFYLHYESNGWMVGSSRMRSWQAAVMRWAKENDRNDSNTNKAKYYNNGKEINERNESNRRWIAEQFAEAERIAQRKGAGVVPVGAAGE